MGEAKRRASLPALISVLIPERGRPEKLERAIRSLLDRAGGDTAVEILVQIDDDDEAWFGAEPAGHPQLRILYKPRPITLGEKLNELANEANGDILFFFANDVVMESEGWPQVMRAAVNRLPNGYGVCYAKDDLHPGHASYWLMTRRMRDAVGFFAPPWFPYWFADTWWDEIGIMMQEHHQINVEVGSPDGRGKTHGMVDLPFWANLFLEMRPLRMRDTINLATLAHGEKTPALADIMAAIPTRNALCVARNQRLASAEHLEEWGRDSDSAPAPRYAEAKEYAEGLLKQIREQTPRRPKVAIACPSGRTWEATTGCSIAAMGIHTMQHGIEIALLNVQTSQISQGRNSTVEIAMKENCDYIMFVDSDMKFPPDTLIRLMRHDKDICGCVYNKRVPPFETLGKLIGPKPEVMDGSLHEAALLPGGMILVKMDVFRRIGYPYYAECHRFPQKDGLEAWKSLMRNYFTDAPPEEYLAELDGTRLGEWLRTGNSFGLDGETYPNWSEDLYFCRRARRAGFRIWADIALSWELVHLGTLEVTTLNPKLPEKVLPEAAD